MRVSTGREGRFTLAGLSPDLYFDLLIVCDGHEPTFVRLVDPLSNDPVKAVVRPRPAIADSRRVVKGTVVDPDGRLFRDAVVTSFGIQHKDHGGQPISRYFGVSGLEPLAVTNAKGAALDLGDIALVSSYTLKGKSA